MKLKKNVQVTHKKVGKIKQNERTMNCTLWSSGIYSEDKLKIHVILRGICVIDLLAG